MRFRLRTLLVVFLLLCVSAPWWNEWRRDLSEWIRLQKMTEDERIAEEIHREFPDLDIKICRTWRERFEQQIRKMQIAESQQN
jgi:hypothetical protein